MSKSFAKKRELTNNNELRRKREIFEVIGENTWKNGFRDPIFNYFSNRRYKKQIELIKKIFKSRGMSNRDFVKAWMKKTSIPQNRAENILRGNGASSQILEAWEYFEILALLGLKLTIEDEFEYAFTSRIEESVYGAKIMIQSTKLIKFTIIMNREDYYDFHVEFAKEQIIEYKMLRYFNAVWEGIAWYFQQDGKRCIPVNKRKFYANFNAKWVNGEFHIVREIK